MKRILFVDDEPCILEGLRRTLRSMRGAWSMSFAGSGEEALHRMEEQPFDVVISDMKMPRMDGTSLLGLVQQIHPGTIRIILSGQADANACLHSIPVTHQFFSKPCDVEELKRSVEACCALESMLADAVLREAVAGTREFSVRPQTHEDLARAVRTSDFAPSRIALLIEQEPPIAAVLLRLAFSNYLGHGEGLTSLEEAFQFVGPRILRELLLAVPVFRPRADEAAGICLESVRRHSLLTARIARKLVEPPEDAGRAFLAGLVHDLGKWVLSSALPDRSRRIVAALAEEHRGFHEVERDLFGATHARIGAYLMALWGTPDWLVTSIAGHHDPAEIPAGGRLNVAGAVWVASLLASEQEGESGEAGESLATLERSSRFSDWRRVASEEWRLIDGFQLSLPTGEVFA